MKSGLFTKLLIIAFGAFLWMSHSDGRAAEKNQGNTGAPGDSSTTCGASSCHGMTNILVNLDIEVRNSDNSLVTSYIAGDAYTVTVRVNHTGGNNPAGFGFQMVALKDAGNESTNSFANPSSNAQLATVTTNGRQYVEQDGASSTNTFTVQWTAPTTGSGSITFYAAGNGVNLNNNKSGDGANNTSVTITENTSSANQNTISNKWDLKLFPNPVAQDLNIALNSDFDGKYLVTILDAIGREIQSSTRNVEGGKLILSANHLATGNYTLLLQKDHETASVKFVKL